MIELRLLIAFIILKLFDDRKPIDETYVTLVSQVEIIDPSAAHYMMNEARRLRKFVGVTTGNNETCKIDNCFYWYDTPQGTDFWIDIKRKLNKGI